MRNHHDVDAFKYLLQKHERVGPDLDAPIEASGRETVRRKTTNSRQWLSRMSGEHGIEVMCVEHEHIAAMRASQKRSVRQVVRAMEGRRQRGLVVAEDKSRRNEQVQGQTRMKK